jgi:hypothetical protein
MIAKADGVSVDYPRPVVLATLLAAIADPAFETELGVQARRAAEQHPECQDFPWMAKVTHDSDPAAHLATIALAQTAASVARETRERTRHQKEERRQAAEREKQRTRLTVRRDALLKHVDRLPDTYLSVGGFIGGSIFLSLFLWTIVGSILWGINVYRPAHESAYFWPSFIGGPVLMAVFAIIRALAVRRSDYLQDQMTSLDRQMEELDGKRMQTEVISTRRAKILYEVEEKRRTYLLLKNLYGENSSPAKKAKKEWDRLRKKI